MRKILREKTRKEKEEDFESVIVSVAEYNCSVGYKHIENVLWNCEKCKVLFENNDTIIKKGNKVFCPLTKLLGFKQCGNSLMRAAKEYWDLNYLIDPPFLTTDL